MGKQWKQWETILGAPKSLQMVTATMKLKDACSLEERLWPAWIALKSRDITLPAKVCLVKAMVFPVVMCGRESWTIKKAERRRINAFELWCLEKTPKSPLDSKEIQPVHPKGNQSWIFHWKDWCLSWSSNTLAIWCEELTHWKRPWCWERLKAGGEKDSRGWDSWMASLT